MRKLTALLVALSLSFPLLAAEKKTAEEAITEAFAAVTPTRPNSIRPSEIDGLYEVRVGSQVVYASADGQYVIQGDLIDLKNQVNLTEARRSKARTSVLEEVPDDSMIVYSPEGETKHAVTVFTDIDCGYCRKLHREMGKMNELGIEVRYLSYPRAGIGSASYEKAVSVWCADDRRKAMDNAKAGGEIVEKRCDSPVKKHIDMANKVGVKGTPAIFLENGRMLPGYMPAERLAKVLEKN